MNFGGRTRQTGLTVDTTTDATEPLAAASDNHHLTNAAATPPGVRGHHDLRSPGVKKTPTAIGGGGFAVEYEDNSDNDDVELLPTLAMAAGSPSPPITTAAAAAAAAAAAEQQSFIPDFITQTDRYGNATTPRNGGSTSVGGSNGTTIVQQQTAGDLQQQQQQQTDASVDSYDTILEGFKSMMCCCLLPPNDGSGQQHQQHNNNVNGQSNNNNNDTSMNGSNGMMININSPTNANNNMLGYSTRGHDAPLLFEEDSALRNSANPNRIKLLPHIHASDYGKKCLVLDLDETLVHSSFRAVPGADFVLPVQIDDVVHFVYVMKRPGVDEFLIEMSKYYEIVIYTASLNKYADPLLDLLDTDRTIRTRLFRESCVFYGGNYVKDLSLINRDLKQSIIIDNSPSSYMFHPENAIDCSSFIDDPNDCELGHIGKFLIGIKDVEDVRGTVNLWRHWPNIDISISHYQTEG